MICKHQSTKLNSSKYCYVSLNSLKHQPIVYTQLNDQTVLFQTYQFCIIPLFALSLNVKQFYLTHRVNPIRCYHSGPEWTREHWQWRSTLYSPKLQHYWSLLIRLFNAIPRTFIGGEVVPLSRDAVGLFVCPSWLGYVKMSTHNTQVCIKCLVIGG